MLATGDGGMDVVAQFVSIIPNGYTKDGRDGEEFKSAVAQILGSVGRDVSALPAIAQAAAVAQWFKRSRPPHEMTPYVVNKHLEIERRAGTDAHTRFAPIFVIGWRVAYPFLAKLWPNRVEDILTCESHVQFLCNISSYKLSILQLHVIVNERVPKLSTRGPRPPPCLNPARVHVMVQATSNSRFRERRPNINIQFTPERGALEAHAPPQHPNPACPHIDFGTGYE